MQPVPNAMANLRDSMLEWSAKETEIQDAEKKAREEAEKKYHEDARKFVKDHLPEPQPYVPTHSRTVMGVDIFDYYKNKKDYDTIWEDQRRANADFGKPVVVHGANHGQVTTTGPIYQPYAESLFNDNANHAYSPWRKT